MKRPQTTTMGGLGGLAASFQMLSALFGDYKFGEVTKAIEHIVIADFIIALATIAASFLAIYYNENKESPPPTVEND